MQLQDRQVLVPEVPTMLLKNLQGLYDTASSYKQQVIPTDGKWLFSEPSQLSSNIELSKNIQRQRDHDTIIRRLLRISLV